MAAWIGIAAAVACFHLAYAVPLLSFLVLGWVAGLLVFARHVATPRQAFYGGLAAGLLVVAPQLWFFVAIFGPAGAVLWGVVALWTALFVVLARQAFLRLAPWKAALLFPFLWTGLEYFRCELYYLRFGWLTPGLAFAGSLPDAGILALGVYGAGFAVAAAAVPAVVLRGRARWIAGVAAAGAVLVSAHLAPAGPASAGRPFRASGVQLEGADASGIPARLDALLAEHPDTDLVVLPEYVFHGPPPPEVLDWCRRRRMHLVAGGMELLKGDEFRNTAYVVGPGGTVIHRQVKSVPIQFFADGLPAERQEIWESPWGRIGLCVCYDLTYTRVVDRLVAMGAQAIVVPTMDAAHWGAHQHELHARIAPARAAEYGVPVVRVCSSGISQIAGPSGNVVASAPFPGPGATVSGLIQPSERGRLPPDRLPAPFAVAVTSLWAAFLLIDAARRRTSGRRCPPDRPATNGAPGPRPGPPHTGS